MYQEKNVLYKLFHLSKILNLASNKYSEWDKLKGYKIYKQKGVNVKVSFAFKRLKEITIRITFFILSKLTKFSGPLFETFLASSENSFRYLDQRSCNFNQILTRASK